MDMILAETSRDPSIAENLRKQAEMRKQLFEKQKLN